MKEKRKLTLKLTKKALLRLGLYTLCVLCCLGLLIAYHSVSRNLLSQQAAERWRGDSETRYAQVSAFLPLTETVSEGDIVSFRQKLEQKLTDASLEAPETGSLWTDAYTAAGEITLRVPDSSGSTSAHALGVGGDFFFFHPYQLRHGSYLTAYDVNDDRIVIDEELAWKLFGAVDVAGLTVYIGNEPYVIAGVISREEDRFSTAAYGDTGAGAFLPYSAFYQLTEAEINTYELVAADPISGFALNVLDSEFPLGSGETLENSSRYGVERIAGLLADFGTRSMGRNGVAYPYWENAARMTEDYLILFLLLAVLFALPPLILVLRIVIRRLCRLNAKLKQRVREKREYV